MGDIPVNRLVAVGFGLLIAWELLFLPISNLWLLFPREQPPLPAEIVTQYQHRGRTTSSNELQFCIESVGRVNDFWANATGQIPGWALFAPVIPEVGVFVDLTMESADGKSFAVRSHFEPSDPKSYYRFEMSQNRIFNRDGMFGMVFENWNPDSYEKYATHWKKTINDQAVTFEISYAKYIRWHVSQWEATHPDQKIESVKLGMRLFQTSKPGVVPVRQEPVVIPVLLWEANKPAVLKPYDPVWRVYVEMVKAER